MFPYTSSLEARPTTGCAPYASQIQFDWGPVCAPMVTPEDYANAARKAMAEGYTAIKVDPVGFNTKGNWMEWSNYGLLEYDQLKVAVDRVAAIREAGGPGLDIIIELHSLTDTNTAIQLGRELEQYRCFYYEEPTQPLNPSLFQRIRTMSGFQMHPARGYTPDGATVPSMRTVPSASSSLTCATQAA